MSSWLRQQWLEAISAWRKAPLCFSLGALFCAGWVLSVALLFWDCGCGGSVLFYVFLPVVEHFHPGIDAPDNWALGITYWLYFVMALTVGCIVFFWAAVWRVYRKTPRKMERRETSRPDHSGGQVQE